MSSTDLFNQARVKREEAQRCRDQGIGLANAGGNLGGSLGPVAFAFGPQTWLGPNATRVGRLLDSCFSALQNATSSLSGDAQSLYLKARWLDEQAEVLESDARMMARVEAEAEAARQRAIAEAAAAQARAAQAAAAAASAAAAKASQPASPSATTTPAAPALVFAPIATVAPPAPAAPAAPSSSSSSSSSSGSEDDYSGWY
jgi:hypothetical protein